MGVHRFMGQANKHSRIDLQVQSQPSNPSQVSKQRVHHSTPAFAAGEGQCWCKMASLERAGGQVRERIDSRFTLPQNCLLFKEALENYPWPSSTKAGGAGGGEFATCANDWGTVSIKHDICPFTRNFLARLLCKPYCLWSKAACICTLH